MEDSRAAEIFVAISFCRALASTICAAYCPAIVQEQLNYPTIDVFNGKEFTEEEETIFSDTPMISS